MTPDERFAILETKLDATQKLLQEIQGSLNSVSDKVNIVAVLSAEITRSKDDINNIGQIARGADRKINRWINVAYGVFIASGLFGSVIGIYMKDRMNQLDTVIINTYTMGKDLERHESNISTLKRKGLLD